MMAPRAERPARRLSSTPRRTDVYKRQHWDGTNLHFGPGLAATLVPNDVALAAQWRDYGPDILAAARIGTAIPQAEALDEDPRPPDRPPIGPVVVGVQLTVMS